MFEELFERNHAFTRHSSGPLASERRGYLLHLASQVVAHYLLAITVRLRLADRPHQSIDLKEINRCARSWGCRTLAMPITQPSTSRRRFIRQSTRWLRFMGRLELPPQCPKPHVKLLASFEAYMHEEQGLSPQTITYRCVMVQEFLTALTRRACSLRDISAREIDQWLVGKANRRVYARSTIQTRASTLRGFFHYAEQKDWCRGGLADTIKSPRCYSGESLPLGPSWREVRQLLSCLKGNHPSAIRDRAIILLLSVYGLRAGKVAGLRLADFDWKRELLRVNRESRFVSIAAFGTVPSAIDLRHGARMGFISSVA